MSQEPINLSPDLRRLREEGYDIEIKWGHLLLKDVPYVNANREVKRAILVSSLDLAGDVTILPSTHVAQFTGEYPCHKDGAPIEQIRHVSQDQQLAEGVLIKHSFSSKPAEGYPDYYDKMTTYAAILSGPAEAIDPTATAKTHPIIEANPGNSVFNYEETASGRVGITAVNDKLKGQKIAIVGVGGTGSYVLDLVAKTPVEEIHLIDGDKFDQHNAFRSPGAPSKQELKDRPSKIAYLGAIYSKMRRQIYLHECFLDASNVNLLQGMDFVFICVDRGDVKAIIVEMLEAQGTPFIDVGMGIELVNNMLTGILRTTLSASEKRDHFRTRVSLTNEGGKDAYTENIQIADLNALNASLAVIKWKKLMGYYADLEREFNSTYEIDGNKLGNEDAV